MLAFQLQLRINLTTDMQTCNAMEEALAAFQQTSLRCYGTLGAGHL
jgi:hypothetical protein